jgi:hypothetical protein
MRLFITRWLIGTGYLAFLPVYLAAGLFLYLSRPLVEHSDTFSYYTSRDLSLTERAFWVNYPFLTHKFLFRLFDGPQLSLFHLLLAFVAWSALAISVAGRLERRVLRWGACAGLLAYSLSPQVFLWHRVLYTESFSFSLFALLLALGFALQTYLQTPRPLYTQIIVAIGYLVGLLIYAFTRDVNAYTVLGVVGLFSLWAWWRWREGAGHWRTFAVTLTMGGLGIFALVETTANLGLRWQYPLVNVIAYRILPDPAKRAYFVAHGLPDTPEVEAISRQQPVVAWSPLLPWLQTEGKRTYQRYLLTHPLESFSAPLRHWGEIFNQDAYPWSGRGESPPLQGLIGFLFFPQGAWFIGLGLMSLGLTTWLMSRGFRQVYWLIPILLLGVAYPSAFLNWHGDTMDKERHVLGVVILTHLSLWLSLLFSLDRMPLERLSPVFVLLGGLGLCGLVGEAFLRQDTLNRLAVNPILQRLDSNPLGAWGLSDTEFVIYQSTGGQPFITWRVVDPSKTSAENRLLRHDSWLDVLPVRQVERYQVAEQAWQAAPLPAYLAALGADYLFYDSRLWARLPAYQQATLSDPLFYLTVWEKQDTTNRQWGRLVRRLNAADRWPDQSRPSYLQGGLNDADFAAWQAFQTQMEADLTGARIFNPERQLEPPAQAQIRLGRVLATYPAPELRPSTFALLFFLSRAQTEATLSLTAEQKDLLAAWRESKEAHFLGGLGFTHLFFSQTWWGYLSEAETARFEAEEDYLLQETWSSPLMGQFYRLYRLAE